MSFPVKNQTLLLVSLCLIFICSQVSFAKDDWRPITSEELSMTKGKVEADADAEAIFWEVRINDASQNLVMNHYVRVKILTERGREKFSKVDIGYAKGKKIRDIEARVIKQDGTIVELQKEDVFDREIVKTDDVKYKAKSFAVPNIETGVIVEYKYKEVIRNGLAEDMRMIFQKDIPLQNIAYYFKPATGVRYLTFNLSGNKFIKDKRGFYKAEMKNMPALKEEANMPPEDEVRPWLLVYYVLSKRAMKGTTSDFWARTGGYLARRYEIKDTLKPGKKMKAAAKEIIAGANTDEEKVRKLFDFCKTKVKNISFDINMTDEEKEKIKFNKDDDATYKKMQGRSYEVNKLFASLADAAGFETRIAFTGDRSQLFFNPKRAHESFIHMAGVAIKLNNRWEYFDPGSPFLPYKKLAWFEENTSVFLLAYKDYITTRTSLSSYDESAENRTGKFKLSEDGTLEGTVEIKYTGQFSYRKKMNNYDISANAREEQLKESIKQRISTAEVSNISIENVTDPEKPFTYRFKVRVPNYAQKTGKRIFLQPGFFTFGTSPRFASSTRKHAIYFKFPWSESDEIEIELPEGYVLDNAESPAPLADDSNISSLENSIGFNKKSNILTVKRKFHFGGGDNILFQVGSYPAVKGLFDAFHKSDTHTITLQKKAVLAK